MPNNEDNESFRKELRVQLAQFEIFLQQKLKPRTIYRHSVAIANLIDFLCCDCDASNFQSVRRSMVGSRFRQWYCNNPTDVAVAMAG